MSFQKWILESPLTEWGSQHLQDIVLGALRQGPVPQHIAFVMDGNRRFARNHHMETIEGHNLGFEAMARTLEICYKIGVKAVTMYAFSIENFKRTKFEVDALMDMAKFKLAQLAEHGELLDKYEARIQFLGRRDLIRPDVLRALDHAIELTRGNGKATLNICAPYTSRDEITYAIRATVEDFVQPLKPRSNRSFSESHITRNIRAQQLGTVSEEPEISESKSAEEQADASAEVEGLFRYEPSTPETKAAFGEMVSLVRAAAVKRSNEEMDPVAVEQVTSALVRYFKGESIHQDEKETALRKILGDDFKSSDHVRFQELADLLHDYKYPSDLTVDSSSTLITGKESNPAGPPPGKFPDPETITAGTLTAHTFTGADMPPLDILIRTSGVERLSDFMLWQCHQHTEINFLKCMWPEFGLWKFLPVLLEWQWRRRQSGGVARRKTRHRKRE